ncbi:3-like protein, partial [Globisporangium splendens]
MVAEVVVQLVRAGASLAACAMFASLLPAVRAAQRTGATGALALLPILSMFANCIGWGLYGVLRRDYFPLVVTNVVGVGFSLFYTVAFYQITNARGAVLKKILVTYAALLAFVLYPVYSDEPAQDVQDHVGYMAVGIAAIMFASPLAVVREVIATRNAAIMPFTLIAAGVLNCLLWLTYGLILADSFVIAPNLVNLILGVTQLMLFFVFPKDQKYDKVDADKKEKQAAESVEIELELQEETPKLAAPESTEMEKLQEEKDTQAPESTETEVQEEKAKQAPESEESELKVAVVA